MKKIKISLVEAIPDRLSILKKVLTELITTDGALKDVKLHINHLENHDNNSNEKVVTIIDLTQNQVEIDEFQRKGYAWWPKLCKKIVEERRHNKNTVFIIIVFTDLPYSIAGEAWAKSLFCASTGNDIDAFFIYDGENVDKEKISRKLLKAVVALSN